MHHSDKSSPLKDDIRARSLRSSSPAIKRPASDMGGQEREDYAKDVEMQDGDAGLSPNAQLASNGKRQKNDSHASDPNPVSQMAPSKESSVSESTIPSSTVSTAPTSILEPTDPSTRPSIDEQVVKVMQLAQETPQDGQKGYVISCRWLSRVLARCSEPPPGLTIDKSAMEEEIGPVNNADIAMVTEDSGKLRDEAGELFTPLRPGLTIGEDMQILPQPAWDLIIQWYGLAPDSPVITRYAHALSEENPLETQFELNPPIFSFLKVVGTHTLQTQKDADLPPPRMVASVHKPFMKWLKEAKELVHTDMNTKVRVWRILGGLRSTSASGILTPAASRSASPAPGAEIIASAGSKMIIDVNTFSLLTLGDQRELIEQKDQTMNENYNGKVDLRTIGLGRSDVIVLEEQTSKADEYPSENQKLSLKGSMKAKNLSVSGRSSPTPSIMTRGRAQREGKPKGIVGLVNLGNTCYMNSALQCVRSVDELTEYFRCNYWQKEVNYDNPLGNHGEVAKAYAGFINAVYSSTGAYSPAPFKRVIGKYGPNFAGYGQQDSQEFVAFLLDGLSEDLNRIHKKPYIEKPDSTDEMVHNPQLLKEFADRNWTDFKARNDSVVIDLFAGMYKSTLKCPVCDKVSIVFDPFTTLTMQLPIENNWSKEIVYFPLFGKPYRVDVDIDKNSTMLDLKKFVSQRTKYDPTKMICAESYKNRFFKIFDNSETITEVNISANDIICIYELLEKPTNYNADKKKRFSQFSYSNRDADPKVEPHSPAADKLLTTVLHRVRRPNGNNRVVSTFFGHPSFIVLSRDDRRSYDALFKKMLTQVVGMTTFDVLKDGAPLDEADATPEDSDTLVVSNESTGSQSPSASATSMQDEDGIVDVSMGDDAEDRDGLYSGHPDIQKLMKARRVPKKFLQLFDIRVVPTEDGIPLGWNSIHEDKPYVSAKGRAAEMASTLAHRPRRSIDDENFDSGISDIADTEQDDSSRSQDSASEAGDSPKQPSEDDIELPDVSEMFSGKDARGASKHQKKKTYSRKGKKIQGKAPRKSPLSPQPKPASAQTREIVLPGDAIILDWDLDCYDVLFAGSAGDDDGMRGTLTHQDIELLEDEELVAKRASRLDRKKNGVSLTDCLDEFEKTETLSEQNAWYCPRCKEHRRADKRFELWKAPDILVMHLKRFSSSRDFRNKLDVKVDYPVEGLDLSSMVRDQSDGKSLVYDLIAVDNHFGGLGGGHYTAMAKNSVTNNWYDYNDSHVSQVKDHDAVVSKSAYLLFYRRRTDPEVPLGGEQLEKILTEVDSDETTQSREQSPSGEGQRLGGSSHNGSSSAFGRPHHVGDGGSASQQKLKGPVRSQHEGEAHQIFIGPELPPGHEALPSYENADSDMLLTEQDDTPWMSQPSWGFSNLQGSGAPPSSENGDNDNIAFAGLGRRGSNVSAANASSTAGMGGSVGHLSDLEDDIPLHSFDEKQPILPPRADRESAPPPEVGSQQSIQQVHNVPFAASGVQQDDEEDLEVQELRIDESKSDRAS